MNIAFTTAVALLFTAAFANASPIPNPVTVSQVEFEKTLVSTNAVAYAKWRVGDSLNNLLTGAQDPEMFLGRTPSAIERTEQYNWPVNWMQSRFVLSFRIADRALSFTLGDTAIELHDVEDFDTLTVGATAWTAALYAHPFAINGIALPSLTPNGYGYGPYAHFDGFRIDSDILRNDFTMAGLVYFDGGYQTGDSNMMEFILTRENQVPEPSSLALSVGALAIVAGVRRQTRT